MWLDLVPISHRACVHFAADRQNPSGIQHDAALLFAWLDHVLHVKRCHLLSCDGVTVGRGGTPKFFTFAVVQACHTVSGQVCLDLMSLTSPCGDETAGGSILLIRASFGSYRSYG